MQDKGRGRVKPGVKACLRRDLEKTYNKSAVSFHNSTISNKRLKEFILDN